MCRKIWWVDCDERKLINVLNMLKLTLGSLGNAIDTLQYSKSFTYTLNGSGNVIYVFSSDVFYFRGEKNAKKGKSGRIRK